MIFSMFFEHWLVFLLFSLLVFLPLLYFTWQGAPFVKTTDEDLEIMLSLASSKKGGRMVDIGSGDGKIVIAFAKKDFKADGYEIDLRLVRRSRKEIEREGLAKKARIYGKSFWSMDFSSYDVVTVYGIHHIMGRLEKKLRSELPIGSIVLSNYYSFPNWKIEKSRGRIKRYIA